MTRAILAVDRLEDLAELTHEAARIASYCWRHNLDHSIANPANNLADTLERRIKAEVSQADHDTLVALLGRDIYQKTNFFRHIAEKALAAAKQSKRRRELVEERERLRRRLEQIEEELANPDPVSDGREEMNHG